LVPLIGEHRDPGGKDGGHGAILVRKIWLQPTPSVDYTQTWFFGLFALL
jgi:hypothetical protein